MVAPHKPTRVKALDRLAGGSPTPFVRLPRSVRDLDDLMRFDRLTCETHPQFVRPVHRADLAGCPVDFRAAGAVVLVSRVSPGVRTRLFFPAGEWRFAGAGG